MFAQGPAVTGGRTSRIMLISVLAHRIALVCALAGASACRASEPPVPVRPNVLLVTLDTVRADRLGRGMTPTLSRLASQGLTFDRARTVTPLTLPAHATILTGLYPAAHGLRLNGAGRLGVPTIASDLQAAGYATRAVVGAFVLDRRFGLDAGFDEYDDRIDRDPRATDRLEAERPANVVADRAIAMLDGLSDTTPWLLWAHFYDAHAPYTPPAEARSRAGGEAYDGEIAFVDGELARLLARLETRSDRSRTAVVVVGDHGESLGEHGEPTHGMLLFEPAVRVPLIIVAPALPAGEVRRAASVIDIAPTIRALAGVPPRDTPGRNLAGPPNDDVEHYLETDYPTLAGWAPVRALVRERWKLVAAAQPALFDLDNDPGERTDLSAGEPLLARGMARRITEMGAERPASPSAPVPPDVASRLRSLGYVSASQTHVAPRANAPDPAAHMSDWASFEQALAQVGAGRPADALPALGRLVSAHADAQLFVATYARALAATGRPQEALAHLRRAVERWPGDASLYHELAVVARDTGRASEALKAEEAALVLAPNDPLALNGKGLLLADAGRHEEAARAFDAATAADPTNAVYLANLGNAQRALGHLPAAAEAYRRALDRDARLGDAANGLGVVLVQQGRPGDAVRWLELAAEDPAFIEAQLNLGIALQQTGDRVRASAQYRKVLTAPARYARERDAARALLAQVEGR